MTIKDLTPSQTELLDACRRGEYEKVRLWISTKKNKRPRTPLNIFRPSTPNNWLSSLKDPTTFYTPLHYTALNGHDKVSKLLLDLEPQLAACKDKRGCVPLHLAAWNGHLPIVKMLVMVDPQSVDNTNSALETPLHLAAQHCHDSVVKFLLEKHGNAKLRNARNECALDIAARVGHPTVCKLITTFCPELALQSAADSSSTREHEPSLVVYPLHAAARHSHIQCLQILRKAGFDLNFVTEEGSALHVAAMFGQTEAVRFLINEGIATNLCNSRGQTAIELLEDLEKQRTSDMTQIIQSRDGWSDCAKIIEEESTPLKSDHLNSSSDSGIDRRDSERFARRSQSIETEREVIWKQVPPTSSSHYYNREMIQQPKYRNSVADNRDLSSPGVSNEEDSSGGSDMASYPSSTINRTWNSRMYDRGGIPRFPVTSPFNKSRHNTFQRTSDTLPVSFSNIRTKPTGQRGTILPQKNDIFSAYPEQEHVPKFPYDNVPSNSTRVIDGRNHHTIGRSGEITTPLRDGCQTLPAGRTRVRAPITSTTFVRMNESPQRMAHQRMKTKTSRCAIDREESLGLTQSPRLDTRASSVISTLTYVCNSLDDEDRGPVVYRGRAPLALPEELTYSATNSVVGASVSPDREFREGSVTINVSDRANYDNPPSPNTSQATIFDAIYGTANRAKPTFSPTSTECSDSTVASSCSLQMISQLSLTPPNVQSPVKHKRAGDMKAANTEVRIRPDYHLVDEGYAEKMRTSSTKSINMADEWKQIDDILASYGAAPCRESVFVRDYEPQVAVYLRDRRSQALTLQLLNAPVDRSEEQQIKFPTNILTISEWLELKVGLQPLVARDTGALLTKYGFDKYTQLKGSLTPLIMASLGIVKSTQMAITNQVETMEDHRPSALSFNYVSDWLCSLELTDYLGNFVNAGYKSMAIVRSSEMTKEELTRIGIQLPGHIARILYSLQCAKSVSSEEMKTRKEQWASSERVTSKQIAQRSATSSPETVPQLKQNELLHQGVFFSAHYLGCREISNVDGTEESRKVMEKLKKSIRDIINVPQVFLEVSVKGVKILDHSRKSVSAFHDVARIQIVCQDERDLNCFTYITQESDKHYCNVFCVLTADVATEIIVTLGQAFELAYKLQNDIPLEKKINVNN